MASGMISTALTAGLLASVLAAPSPAMADDPRDPEMQTRAARERDRELTRQLNQEQLDYVNRRDAEYARGWQATRDHEAAMRDYERRLAEWRHAVEMCEAGYREYCAR